jgi:3-hydroxy acid dehydrogenase/malonic semialdehyde reductase
VAAVNRINGRTVLITGATAGIGEACAHAFASMGARLAICGRREERLAQLTKELAKDHGVDVRPRVLDVRERAAVEAWARDLENQDFMPDVIVNNAGLARGLANVQDADVDDWEEMVDANINGMLYVTRAFLPNMVARNRGHVVNIGSIAGRWTYPKGAVYCATKAAVASFSEGLNMDLVGTRVRVSSVDPGMVETEFSEVRFKGDHERAAKVYQGVHMPMTGADVAEIVTFVVNAPEHVDIFNVVAMPTAQRNPFVLHREQV